MRRSTSPTLAAANNPAYSDSCTADRADDRNLSGVTRDWAIDESQRVVSEAGGGNTGEVVVGSGDRARARPGQIRGVGKKFENHVGGMVQAVAGGSISEKTIETVEGVEGGVGEFAGEGAGGERGREWRFRQSHKIRGVGQDGG
jgi:hypothetical protein